VLQEKWRGVDMLNYVEPKFPDVWAYAHWGFLFMIMCCVAVWMFGDWMPLLFVEKWRELWVHTRWNVHTADIIIIYIIFPRSSDGMFCIIWVVWCAKVMVVYFRECKNSCYWAVLWFPAALCSLSLSVRVHVRTRVSKWGMKNGYRHASRW
jgi:hypothetical protein